MPFGAAGLSTSRTAVSRFKAVLSEEVSCAGASGAATAARQLALLAPGTHKVYSCDIHLPWKSTSRGDVMQRRPNGIQKQHTECCLSPIPASAKACTPL